MVATIHQSGASNALYTNLNKANQNLQSSLEQVGSGMRVNSSKDDAASSAIASSLTSSLKGFEKAHQNTSQAMSVFKTMESTIENLTSQLQRVEALVIQSESSTLSSKNKSIMQSEISAIFQQMDKSTNTTHFNGMSLFSGSKSTTASNPFSSNVGSPTSYVFGQGIAYSFDNSVDPTAMEVTYDSNSDCSGGTLYMTNLETGAYQSVVIKAAEIGGSNSYSLDQLGATITTSPAFVSTTDLGYVANTATTSGTGQILANSSGDINCMGVTTDNNNIAITQTTGMIDDITSTTVATSGTKSSSVTFTLSAAGGDFVANNVDLSTTGTKSINLSRSYGSGSTADSITVQFTVTAAFVPNDIGEKTSLSLTQLKNIVIADSSTSSSTQTFSFQVNTGEAGSQSDNQYSIQAPSLSTSSLGIDKVDLRNSSQSSSNLNKIRGALSQLEQYRSSMGVAQNQMETQQSNLAVSMENSTAARSALVDLDFAKGVVELTNATVAQQAAQQAIVRSNGTQSQLLQLLQV